MAFCSAVPLRRGACRNTYEWANNLSSQCSEDSIHHLMLPFGDCRPSEQATTRFRNGLDFLDQRLLQRFRFGFGHGCDQSLRVRFPCGKEIGGWFLFQPRLEQLARWTLVQLQMSRSQRLNGCLLCRIQTAIPPRHCDERKDPQRCESSRSHTESHNGFENFLIANPSQAGEFRNGAINLNLGC